MCIESLKLHPWLKLRLVLTFSLENAVLGVDPLLGKSFFKGDQKVLHLKEKVTSVVYMKVKHLCPSKETPQPVWWCMLIILTLERLRQEGRKLEARLLHSKTLS